MINDTPNEDARRNQNVVDFLQIVSNVRLGTCVNKI